MKTTLFRSTISLISIFYSHCLFPLCYSLSPKPDSGSTFPCNIVRLPYFCKDALTPSGKIVNRWKLIETHTSSSRLSPYSNFFKQFFIQNESWETIIKQKTLGTVSSVYHSFKYLPRGLKSFPRSLTFPWCNRRSTKWGRLKCLYHRKIIIKTIKQKILGIRAMLIARPIRWKSQLVLCYHRLLCHLQTASHQTIAVVSQEYSKVVPLSLKAAASTIRSAARSSTQKMFRTMHLLLYKTHRYMRNMFLTLTEYINQINVSAILKTFNSIIDLLPKISFSACYKHCCRLLTPLRHLRPTIQASGWIHPKIVDAWKYIVEGRGQILSSFKIGSSDPQPTLVTGCSRECSTDLIVKAMKLGAEVHQWMNYNVGTHIAFIPEKPKQFDLQCIGSSKTETTTDLHRMESNSGFTLQRLSTFSSHVLEPKQVESLFHLQIDLVTLLVKWNVGPSMMGKSTLFASVRHGDLIPSINQTHHLVNLDQWVSLLALLTKGGIQFESGSQLLPPLVKLELSTTFAALPHLCKKPLLPLLNRMGVSIVHNTGNYLGHLEFRIVPKSSQIDHQMGQSRFWYFSRSLFSAIGRVLSLTFSPNQIVFNKSWSPFITVHPLIHSSLKLGMVYDVSSNILFHVHDLYPLHLRPLGPLLLPAPQSPISIIQSTFGTSARPLSQCYASKLIQSSFPTPGLSSPDSLESSILISEQSILSSFYPFVGPPGAKRDCHHLLKSTTRQVENNCIGPQYIDEIFDLDEIALDKHSLVLEMFYPGIGNRLRASLENHKRSDIVIENSTSMNAINIILSRIRWWMKGLIKKNDRGRESTINRHLYGDQSWCHLEKIFRDGVAINDVVIMGGNYAGLYQSQ